LRLYLSSSAALLAACVTYAVLAAAAARPPHASGTHQEAQAPPASDYQWDLPTGFPKPRVPADNPMTVAKVQLGRYLFYDQRLSGNSKQSCATCHQQELAFTDGKAHAVGSTGQLHPRSSMSLVNIAYAGVLTWSDPTQRTLEHQALTPMFNAQPVELGVKNYGADFLRAAKKDPVYKKLFPEAFPGDPSPLTITNLTKAIASFERTIIGGSSPYDKYHYGVDDNAISASAKRGEILFFSSPLSCFRCHGGFNFSDTTDFEGRQGGEGGLVEFHNTGLYNVAGPLSYPAPNLGTYEHTSEPADVGKFKAPTLRNIALTAPYFHDGSALTLTEVFDHYSAGGRSIHTGPDAGDGSKNVNKDPLIHGFNLSERDRMDLAEFLASLTDENLIHDPRFANPWPQAK
jgi:cytochrome c peroxidase